MKSRNLKFLAGCVLASCSFLFIATGCKKSNSGSSAALSATISGTAFQPAATQAVYNQSLAYIAIVGAQINSGDTLNFELDIPDTVSLNKVSTFAGGSDMLYMHTKTGIWYDGYNLNAHGSVTVTSWDKTGHKIGGVFNGVLTGGPDSVAVTNGTFNTAYTLQ
jgi:hypothetical protein